MFKIVAVEDEDVEIDGTIAMITERGDLLIQYGTTVVCAFAHGFWKSFRWITPEVIR